METEIKVSAPRVHIVDDDDSFRTSLIRLLSVSGLPSVGYRCAGEYLLAPPADELSCLILDMCMPGPSGLELLDALSQRESAPPVILVTAFSDIPATVRAMKSGAIDFLVKPVDIQHLLRSIRLALAVDAKRKANRLEVQRVRDRYVQLTSCERDVFTGVVSGKLNKQLAATLGICERSIKSYRSRVMQKMEASSLAGLVRTAKLLGVSEHDSARSHMMKELR